MVRGAYSWNRVLNNGAGSLGLLFRLLGHHWLSGQGLAAAQQLDRRLPAAVCLPAGRAEGPAAKFNHARRVDTILAQPLHTLPPGSFGATKDHNDAIVADLAFRNLARAKMLRLATGQDMVEFAKSRGVKAKALTKARLRDGNKGATLDALTGPQREAFLTRTPLWFYILREPELNHVPAHRRGRADRGRDFHRAIQGSKISILRDTAFRPQFGTNDHTFQIRDLLLFAFEGKKELLAPLG